MNMSDKELDRLFQAKLNNLEEEPSAGLWDDIQNRLDGNVKRWKLTWFYRIAASVLIVGIGAWLAIPERVPLPVVVSKHKAMQLPEAKSGLKGKIANREKEGTKMAVLKEDPAKKLVYKSKKRNQVAVVVVPVAVEKPVNNSVTEETDKRTFHPEIPDLPLAAAILPAGKLSEPVFVEGQDMEATEIHTPVIEKKQTKVRNLGDLVNLVIAKVDKREDKIIEFDKDDEEANISGINLGIVRIKKER